MSTSISTNPTAHCVHTTADRTALRWEIAILLVITFGMSGVRSLLRMIEKFAAPAPLGQQSTTLNSVQSRLPWLDPLFQVLSSAALCAWGGMAVFLLLRHIPALGLQWRFRGSDMLHGCGLAAIIGIPGLAFYATALQFNLTTSVEPSNLGNSWLELPLLVLNSWANGFAEELIVIVWLATRLRQLNVNWVWIFIASSVLRGSYHLYQGPSAGVGNIVMGVVYLYYYKKTGRIWPLVIGHALIDTVAFVGFAAGVRI